MLWYGPETDGVTQSILSKFAQCPYRFYLYAILGLRDNQELHPNLCWGDTFHVGLENYIKTKDINKSILAMHSYRERKYPTSASTFEISTARLLRKFNLESYDGDWKTEIPFKIPVKLPSGRTVFVRGKMDGLCEKHPRCGRMISEHKCKGYTDPQQLRREIAQDRQVNIYCYLHDIEWVNYDLIKIPESIDTKYLPNRSYDESPQQWMERLFTGPCGSYGGMFPINSNSIQWISNTTHFLPREGQETYWDFVVYPELERICVWYDWVTQPGFDHTNPKFYNHIFYRCPVRQFNGSFTEKFQCDYYNYLIGEEDLSDLVPVQSLFSELEDL